MVFQWKTSLQNCFRYYKQNLSMLLGLSILLSVCELSFITMLQHSYDIVDFFPVYLLFFVFLFQYVLLIGIIRVRQGLLSFCSEIIKTGRSKIRSEFYNTKGRFLRGLRGYLTVFIIVIIPALAYYLTLYYIESLITRALISTFLLGAIFVLCNAYQFMQVSASAESKLVNDLKISTTITRMHFKATLLYSFITVYWLIVPIHIWMVETQGRFHFCGCMNEVKMLFVALTILRPIWLLLQVQVYAYVRKTHFPVPEMDPDLRDRNLI